MVELMSYVFMTVVASLVTLRSAGGQLADTQPRITLLVGTSTSIPCGYDGSALTVEWQKGKVGAREADEYVVILENLSDEVRRRFYRDGFNITDDYTLTIHDVGLTDEGRYFCTVSDGATGTFTTSHTDILVEKLVVLNETTVELQLGGGAIIPCIFNATTSDVRWKKDGLQVGNGHGYQTSTEDHSLIVDHVTMQDKGTYVCEYSDRNKKTLYKQVTHVTVIGTPVSPFPTIDVCSKKEEAIQNCTENSFAVLNLTCLVNSYFPSISLDFLHYQEIVAALTTIETKNLDGTKNKEISIRAAPSNEPYVCKAYRIPGTDGERTAVVMITASRERSTTASVIAGIMVIIIIASSLTVYIRRKRRARRNGGNDEESQTELLPLADSLSYIEIWQLLCHAEKQKTLHKLIDALCQSQIINPDENVTYTACQLYVTLCEVKGRNSKVGKELFNIFNKVGRDNVDFLQYQQGQYTSVSDNLAEHVLWNLDAIQIRKLFRGLNLPWDNTKTRSRFEAVGDALAKLQEWRNESTGNLRVQFCRALERADCQSIHKTFFLVREKWMEPISSAEVRKLTSKLTQRHRGKILDVLSTNKSMAQNKARDAKCDTVMEDVFDTSRMIEDWIVPEEGSHYQTRCKLWEAAVKASRFDILGHLVPQLPNDVKYDNNMLQILEHYQSSFISKKEFGNCVKYLNQDQKLQLFEKLGVQTAKKMDDEEIVEKLYQWRDEKLSASPSDMTLRKQLLAAVDGLKYEVSEITDDELRMVAVNLKQEERRKLQSAAETISPAEVSSAELLSDDCMYRYLQRWRSSSSQSSCEKRVTLLNLLRLHTSCSECIAMPRGDYIFEAELSTVGFAMLMEDVLPFSEALGLDTARLDKYRKPPTARCVIPEIRQLVEEASRENGRPRAILCESLVKAGFIDIARMTALNYDQSLSDMYVTTWNLNEKQMESLVTKLGLTPEDITSCRETLDKIRPLDLIERWRRKKHPSPYYYREELARAIMSLDGHQDFATKMLKDIIADINHFHKSTRHLTDEQVQEISSRLRLSEEDLQTCRRTPRETIKLWRNKLHPASYDYRKVFEEALNFLTSGEAVSIEDMPYTEESTWDLLARLPDFDEEDLTTIGINLGLTDDEIESCRVEIDDRLEMLKLWRNKIHPPLYNYRLELARALETADNLGERARQVRAGKYLTENPNLTVMADICGHLTDNERREICTKMNLTVVAENLTGPDFAMMMKRFVTKQGRRQHFSFGDSSKTEEEEGPRLQRKLLMDTIFREGFSDLANELIQYL